ncbi:hypothetical protein T4A_7426 [Trichinella pseudospiralis]|uniref:Uncharacterized protein n=1 Tax=Trichinella pseudospiralis TaxID=6337 RepID=A0A0V1EAJ8_TRIPS|nr:hypothetical protein T4A_7426 [Trichinella pseudospiralis]
MRNNFVNTTTDMKTITHFEELDISNPADWEEYSERLVCFLQANSIREGTIRLAALCSVLRNHFMPISSVSTLFVPADEGSRLREQLVCGLPDGNLQNQLLTDRELTFAKVLERALLAEVAIAQASGIRSLNSTVTTEVQHTRKVTVTARCETFADNKRALNNNHSSRHIEIVSRSKSQSTVKKKSMKPNRHATNSVAVEEEEYRINRLTTSNQVIRILILAFACSPNQVEATEPLNYLLDKGVPWKWTRRHEKACDVQQPSSDGDAVYSRSGRLRGGATGVIPTAPNSKVKDAASNNIQLQQRAKDGQSRVASETRQSLDNTPTLCSLTARTLI